MPTSEKALVEKFQHLEVHHETREKEFDHHEAGVARLNNGSFGSTPLSVLRAQAEWRDKWHKQPDTLVYHHLADGLLESRKLLTKLINAPSVEEVVLVDNVTTAAAAIAQDLVWGFLEGRFKKGDAVLMLNFAYRAVRTCFEGIASRVGARVIYVKIPFPLLGPSEALESLTETLSTFQKENEGATIRLAVLDHVTSMPSMQLPIQDMVRMCRDFAVEHVLVDGAHALGNVEVDVQAVDADFYTSNCHKWLFLPSQVAFLHCKARHLGRLHHPVVSTTYGQGLAAECAWVGTRDYSAQLAVPAAVEFVEKKAGGINRLRCENHDAAVAMGRFLAEQLRTCCGTPPEMATAMVMVGLPPQLRIASNEDAQQLNARLRQEFQIEAPLHHVAEEDQARADRVVKVPGITAYARLSHQIYNTPQHYAQFRDAILAIARESAA